jgi:hypothetical protein
MKPILTIIFTAGVLFAVYLGWQSLDPVQRERREDRAYHQAQIERLERERLEAETAAALAWQDARSAAYSTVEITLIVSLLAALVGAAGLSLYHTHRARLVVWPDAAGNLPVPRRDIEAGAMNEIAAQLLELRRAVELAAAQRPQLPASVVYSPHYAPSLEYDYRTQGSALPEPQAPPALALPGALDLADMAFKPALDRVLLGLGPGGELVTVPLNKLMHVATAGPTGQGKSNFYRLIIAQLQALGARVCVGDPKWTPYDAAQDEDWRAIEAQLYRPAAATAGDIGDLLAWADEELHRRIELRRAGQRPGVPTFLALDELPWIADHVKDAPKAIGELVRLGRGVGLYTLASAQDFLVSTIGLSAARDNFRTAVYLGGDLKTGAVLLDLPQREISAHEAALTVGVALLRSSATTPATLVRIPYASNRALAGLLSAGEGHEGVRSAAEVHEVHFAGVANPPENSGAAKITSPTWDAENRTSGTSGTVDTERYYYVKWMRLRGESKTAIIKAVWGISGGDKYKAASAEYDAIVALLEQEGKRHAA